MLEDLRSKLRSKTVGAVKDFKSEILKYEDLDFEIKEPTEKQRAMIFDRANTKTITTGKPEVKVDLAELAVWALICCTYVPGTNDNVFTAEDYECLMAMPASQLDPIKKKALEFVNIDREKIGKNSDKTTEDTASSN